MTDIAQIPTNELKADRIASIHDIRVCELALLHRVTEYSGGSVKERLDTNRRFVEAIDAELARRGIDICPIHDFYQPCPSCAMVAIDAGVEPAGREER